MERIASIIVDNPSKEVDKPFDYLIPEHMDNLIRIGMRVVVPFGGGNKYIEGYILNIKEESEFGIYRLKSIVDLIDDTVYFSDEMQKIAFYLRKRYICTLGEAFRMIMPSGVNVKENIYLKLKNNIDNALLTKHGKLIKYLSPSSEYKKFKWDPKAGITRAMLYNGEKDGIIEIKRQMEQSVNKKTTEIYRVSDYEKANNFIKEGKKIYRRQIEILSRIIDSGENLTLGELCKKYECSSSVIKGLELKGLLIKDLVEVYRNPADKNYIFDKVELTVDQKNAIENIMSNFRNGKLVTLIHGVTSCGKTEIYLSLAEKAIKQGFGAIVMVPEIALTPQTLERFKGRFGETVAILHSRLSDGERYDEWRRIQEGRVQVVVGARSAVFAPVKKLKLIIIDEEHEYSYKSEVAPKYLTKEIAEFRVRNNNGLLILGSATPSIDSYYKALSGEYGLVEIFKRINNRKLPEVKIINMCHELKSGNKSVFSVELLNSIKSNLEKKEQIILFLNRRGHSTFISCRSCGYVSKCTNCDVSLTYHVHSNKLMCHYCGFEYDIPKTCPKCGSKYIKYFGAGTEKIEMEIRNEFPMAKILRMDMDTTRKKGAHEKIYNEFRDQNADILIGTQMISKGMDFKNVTLVGVVAADTTLNLPDFRAAERTFQLLTQVSGRAGRGETEGKVVVQTYDPDHYSITLASKHDYISFYNREIELRRILKNPPFSDILYVTLASENEEQLINTCMKIGREIQNIIDKKMVEMLGPAPCNIAKIKNSYRWHIILKGNAYPYYGKMDDLLHSMLNGNKVNYSIDMNPFNIG